jgi:hypothetical protein
LVTFCSGYVTGRWGIHFTSWSFPAAMRLPVKVRKPSSTSAMIAVVRNPVSWAEPSPAQR